MAINPNLSAVDFIGGPQIDRNEEASFLSQLPVDETNIYDTALSGLQLAEERQARQLQVENYKSQIENREKERQLKLVQDARAEEKFKYEIEKKKRDAVSEIARDRVKKEIQDLQRAGDVGAVDSLIRNGTILGATEYNNAVKVLQDQFGFDTASPSHLPWQFQIHPQRFATQTSKTNLEESLAQQDRVALFYPVIHKSKSNLPQWHQAPKSA